MLPKRARKSKQKDDRRQGLSTSQIIFAVIAVLVIASFVVSLIAF